MTIPDEEPNRTDPNRREYAVVALLLVFLIVGMFWRVLFHTETFAFRDAGHYYYPFYQSVQSCWQSGLPLWNQLEQLGRPLLADPTAAVLYPGKLVFALPIEFSTAVNLFIVGHVFLAAVTSFITARGFGCSVPASGFCAIGYAFAGPIVFQYCNAVFLIGASWLPLALGLSFRLTRRPDGRTFFGLSLVFALMILGGDVQAVYHALLAQLVLMWSSRTECGWRNSGWLIRWRNLTLPYFAVLIGVCWTAAQFLPSMEWASTSNRAASKEPRNIYELAVQLAKNDEVETTKRWAAFWTTPASGSHRDKTYQFSIGPWRWPELIWPNFSGRQLPVNRRWMNSIPADRRVWVPSLYGGIIVALFAVCASGRRLELRWLRRLLFLSVLASLGGYGVGWLVNEVSFLLGNRTRFWGPVGGLYWLMNLLLPFFNLFRYPAKIWTLVSLACSLLAAFGLDRLNDEWKPLAKATTRLLVGAGGGLIVCFLFRSRLFELWKQAPIDSLLGPLDRQGAFEDLTQSFLHCLLIVGGLALIWRIFKRNQKQLTLAIVLLSATDIYFANRWMVLSAESDTWMKDAPIANAIRDHAKVTHRQSMRSLRAGGSVWYPEHWSAIGNTERIQQCVNWDRQTLRPKYGLLDEIQIVNGKGSFSDSRIERLLLKSSEILPTAETLDKLSIRYVIAPLEQLNSRNDLTPIFQHRVEQQSVAVGYNQNAMPDAWIARFDGKSYLRQATGKKCEVIRVSHVEVVVLAQLDSPGTVVLNDLFASGWQCEVQKIRSELGPTEAKIVPINDLFRGVRVHSAGEYRMVFRYAPSVVYAGFAISLLSITATISIVVVRFLWLDLIGNSKQSEQDR